jgi:hypothetical protein
MRPEFETAPVEDPDRPARRGRRLARLAFVLILTPALHSPLLLGTGLALLGLALVARHRFAAGVQARLGGARDPTPADARSSPSEIP